MNLKAFAARDNRLGLYKTPWFFHHTGEALRAWEDMANNPESYVCKYADDFTLYEVGSFDVDKGEFISFDKPHLLSHAKDARKPSPNVQPVQ